MASLCFLMEKFLIERLRCGPWNLIGFECAIDDFLLFLLLSFELVIQPFLSDSLTMALPLHEAEVIWHSHIVLSFTALSHHILLANKFLLQASLKSDLLSFWILRLVSLRL